MNRPIRPRHSALPLTLVAFLLAFSAASATAQAGTTLCGTLTQNQTLTAAGNPYQVTCGLVVPKGVSLTLEPDVRLEIANGVSITVRGQIFANGSVGAPVVMTSVSGRWGGVVIDHRDDGDDRESSLSYVELSLGTRLLEVNNTGSSSILVEDCKFDLWSSLAIRWDGAHGLVVRRCDVGVETPFEQAEQESINGYRGGATVEYCTFGRRKGYRDVIDLGDASWGEPVPTIRYNTFLGGEDDAIDFDNSAGWIIGNVVMNHWPGPGANPGANGGGITGENSDTVVINNIVIGCYHGIGYKNAGTPLILNNIVIDCGIGLTFYQDACDEAKPNVILFNNIVWNSRDPDTGTPQNVVLNGAWFPRYCQDTSVDQATIDMRYSIIEGGWPGEGNLDLDPLLVDPASGNFELRGDSPALDAGFGGPLAKDGVSTADLLAAWSKDRIGRSKVNLECIGDSGSGTITFGDIGPSELQAPGPCAPQSTFIRGDSNGDGLIDVADAVHILLWIFSPLVADSCSDARDVNDNGDITVSDAIALLSHLFQGSEAPPTPYPTAGADPTKDVLGCERNL